MSPRSATDDHPPLRPVQDALDVALAKVSAVEAQALRWMVRCQDGLDAGAEPELQSWLRASPDHAAAFEDMVGVWRGIDEIPAQGVAQLRAGLALKAAPPQAAAKPAPSAKKKRPSPGWFHGFGQWAPQALSAGLAFCMLGGAFLAWDHWWHLPVFSQHYATARGQQTEVALPDGSSLRLDTASQADVTLYRQRREVRLPEGQIVFKVQGDQARPFDVLAGTTRITVVGTRFSVRYTPSLGRHQVRVAVEEGHVRVARAAAQGEDLASNEVVELLAGDTVATDEHGHLGRVGRVTSAGIAPWRGHRVSFEDTPLADALAELERYGSTGLVVRDPAVAAMRVTGSVDLRRVSDFARSLPQVLPVRLKPALGGAEVAARRP